MCAVTPTGADVRARCPGGLGVRRHSVGVSYTGKGGDRVAKGENGAVASGLIVRGTYLGYQSAKSYQKRDGSTGIEPPKVGIMGRELEYVVSVSDETLADIQELYPKGAAIEVEVDPVAPFGSNGPVRFAAPGLSQRNWQ